LKNKFAPIFFFFFNQRWQWPALVGEFLHQPLLAAFGLPVISLSPAFTSAGLQILSSLAAYGLPVLFMQPALACKASAGYIYISPSLAAYGLPVSSPALACKASVGSPLLAAYGLPVSSYIHIYIYIYKNKYFKYTVYFFNVNPVLFTLVF